MTNLNELRDAIYQDAVEHGLWKKSDDLKSAALLVKQEANELVSACDDISDAVISGESEKIYTALRAYQLELADVIIMSLSAGGHIGIDIDDAVRSKMEINRNRPYQHKEGSK